MPEDVTATQENSATDGRDTPVVLDEGSPAIVSPPAAVETTPAEPSSPACAPGDAERATENPGAAATGVAAEEVDPAANQAKPPPGLSAPEAAEVGAKSPTPSKPSTAPLASAEVPVAAMPVEEQQPGSAASAPVADAPPIDAASSSLAPPAVAAAAPCGATTSARERTQLSADAQVFVSSEQAAQPVQQAVEEAMQQAVQQAYMDDVNFVASLPPAVRQQLRGCFQTPTGEIVSYYVGKLKSFNHSKGYGFIACAQAKAAFGQDVFIHKNWMDNPWSIGQVVEFAVMPNNKGQPQAYDVIWPKQLSTPNHPRPVAEARQGGFSAAGVGVASTGGTGDGHSAAVGLQADASALAHVATRTAAAATNQVRRLGVLKSFAPAQGYGFIECEEVKQSYQRDTYLDKSQLPTNMLWRHGQVVEFSVSLNSRSQPQARDINWDPIPLLPTEAGAPSNANQGRSPTKPTMDKLRKLLELLHKKQHEVAVLTAIDNQGHGTGSAQPAAEAITEMGIDYVTFVLDRAGDPNEAVGIIKDFVKMLLLLMLARMLRAQQDQRRCLQLLRWFHALTESILPSAQGVREHFRSVVQQIKVHTDRAKDANPVLRQEDAPVSSLDAAFAKLQSMADELTAEAAQAAPTTA